MEAGRPVPGYKAVPSYGHTKWTDEEEVVKKLQRKVGKKNLFQQELKSPTQLRKAGFGDLIDKYELTYRPALPPKVVPETNKKEAIEFASPEESFQSEMIGPPDLKSFWEE